MPRGPPNIPPPTVKCLTTFLTSSSGAASVITSGPFHRSPRSARCLPQLSCSSARTTNAVGLPARRDVAPISQWPQRRDFDQTALYSIPAARRERTAGRQSREVGRLPLDGRQPLAPRLIEPRYG